MLYRSGLKRREFIASLAALTTSSIIGCSSTEAENVSSNTEAIKQIEHRDFSFPHSKHLNERAKQKGLFFGAFTGYRAFQADRSLQEVFKRECGLAVGGFYWNQLRPTAKQFDWTMPDIAFNFAKKNGLLFRGHPLVWHKPLSKWILEQLRDSSTTRRDVELILETHISTIMRRYAGQTHSWDVVNEVIKPEDDQPGGLRNSPWLRQMGVDYIDFSFRVAAETDAKALRVLNEVGLEYDTPVHERRRRSLLKLLEQLKAKGTPIQALGIQGHLSGEKPLSALKPFRQFLSDVASMGLKILITELDVTDNKLPAHRGLRDRFVAAAYEDYLSIALDESAVIGVITWGLSDRDSWLADYAPRRDNLPVRPLPFDDQLRRKLAWNAIARAFDNAPSR